MKIEDIVKSEVDNLIKDLDSQITDPVQKLAIATMTADLAMIPIRMARGEDVTHVMASLKAEAAMRGVTASLKAQAAVQQAWMNIIFKILTAALSA